MINEKDIERYEKRKQPDEYESPATEKFPIDVFPDGIRDYIQELKNTLNYNIDYTSIAILYSFAVMNGNCVKLRVKNGWIAPSIFWFVAVGESGTMKSHPLSTIIEPLDKMDKKSFEIYQEEIERWEMENASLKPHEKEPRPVFLQSIMKDYTLEALHQVHSQNKKGLGLYRDEIKAFLGDMNKYRKGSDAEFWLESFNNKSFTINRVSKEPAIIDNISISIIGTTQPEVLSGIIKESNGNGLIERFLFTVAETEIYPINRNDISKERMDYWVHLVDVFQSNCKYDNESSIIDMSKQAFDVFCEKDMEIVSLQKSDDEVGAMKNYLSKMKTYLPRFALLMCLIDRIFYEDTQPIVSGEQMKRACRIIDYFIKSARYIFTETERTNEVKEVAQKYQGKTKKEKILSMHKDGLPQKEIAKILKTHASYVSKIITELSI